MKIGDIVMVTKKGNDGWYEATLNGKSGLVPANYVVKV